MKKEYKYICLPYAGGNANIYNAWENKNVIGIEYDGHGARYKKTFYNTIQEGAEKISDNICKCEYEDYIIFGHSLGAIIAIETVRVLAERNAILPMKIIVSASRPPHLLYKNEKIASLNKELFMKKIFDMGSMPIEIMNNKELFDWSYEVLYADISMLERYQPSERIIVDVPLLVCFGNQDKEADWRDMREWEKYTNSKFELMCFEGNHFFIFNNNKIRNIIFEY